jgi:hypothetical protein
MASNSGLLRRLEKLEHAIRLHRARFIVIEIDDVQEKEGATAALLKAPAIDNSTWHPALRPWHFRLQSKAHSAL